jgi:hypothetical protein
MPERTQLILDVNLLSLFTDKNDSVNWILRIEEPELSPNITEVVDPHGGLNIE